jgi:hypothetical protein
VGGEPEKSLCAVSWLICTGGRRDRDATPLHAAAHVVLPEARPARLTANHAMAQACVLVAGSHGRCPWLSAISPARTPARTDIWRTGPAAKITPKRICAGQEAYSHIRTGGL